MRRLSSFHFIVVTPPENDNRATLARVRSSFPTMIKRPNYAQTSAFPAIAAAMAFLSTPALAQQTQPTPPATDTPATPDAQSAPATQTAPADQSAPASSDTTAPDPSGTASVPATSSATATAKPKPTHARPAEAAATKTTVVHKTARATHSAAAPVPTKAPAPPTPAAAPAAAVAPVPHSKPATPAPKKSGNDTALELGGGTLALLLLGGGAYAIARRRRHDEEEEWYYDEPAVDDVVEPSAAEATTEPEMHEHAMDDHVLAEEQPIVAPAPSAFAWGKGAAAEDHVESTDDDRRPGETWVERAYRGPSANNPSYSLRRRLKRAAFFDKQEREAAQGRSASVANDTNEITAEENKLVPA